MVDESHNGEATTHFGYRDVAVGEKKKLVGQVFSSVAEQYDLMNDLMSMGVHRLWKRHYVSSLGVRAGDQVLDLAGGTGDIAALLLNRVGDEGRVVIGDINAEMLRVGRRRLIDRGLVKGLEYLQVDAQTLPFADESFDRVTMAFGLRNVTDQCAALRSIFGTLKLGGKLSVLEFTRVDKDGLKQLYDLYSFKVLPALGKVIANDEDSYRYLAESIRKHPDHATLQGMFEDAGFEKTDVRLLSGGLVAIHSGYRLQ